MDLKLMAAAPSSAEREAVDAFLGSLPAPAASGPPPRHLLLPALHALVDAIGWISEGGLNHVCERFGVPPAEAYGVASFYALLPTGPRAPVVIHACDDIACRMAGADRVVAVLEEVLGPAGGTDAVTWLPSPCVGACDRAPAAFVQRTNAENATVDGLAPGLPVERLLADLAGREGTDLAIPLRSGSVRIPQIEDGSTELRLLRRIGRLDPARLDDYQAAGGYEALRRAFDLGPEGVVREVSDSRLLGRGGAAFPAGRKWAAVATAPARPHYLVCNADESEPGTFKDRALMEEDPFALVEAMTIAGYATGCETSYLYVRGEYPTATARLEHAIAECRRQGLLGRDVMGAGFDFDIEIRRGGGAYICGEETALFNSIEGFRGEPRNKPPFPTDRGLFGKPTLVNNVETLINVLDIVLEGGPAFAGVGTEASTGTKLFCVSGSVARPGLYEVVFGVTLGELLELAGGVSGGRPRAILLGGAAGTFVPPDRLDIPLTFEGTRAAGASLGSGVVMVFGQAADMNDIVLRIAAFFRHESCGQCVPCRVGTVRQEEALRRFIGGEDEAGLLDEIGRAMGDASICGLGHTAALAARSAISLGLIGNGDRR
ncbi:MAG TPA: NAD(P)H-dependent oxidoreductase subunit E [Gemmatimonadota bacterium]|nr:NAD(P)H-dependent oxidoreductase subunit E [Gemmatimonadota bacterium]